MQKKANERQEGHQGERMIRKIPWMIFGITLFSSSLGYGEEVLLYSYSRISERDGLWGVMPVTTEVSERSPERLFEALKRRKMPTYGGTVYDGNRVTIDESKCMYGSVISSEVDATFTAHGFGTPEYVCGGEKVASAQGALMAYMPVMPLWQAMTAESFNGVSLIAAGDAYLSPSEFVSRLKSHDKALTRAVEKGLESPHDFEKTGLMRGMLRHGFTDAEKRIAKLLESRDETTVIAALTTLSQTKNASTVKAIRTLLTEGGGRSACVERQFCYRRRMRGFVRMRLSLCYRPGQTSILRKPWRKSIKRGIRIFWRVMIAKFSRRRRRVRRK